MIAMGRLLFTRFRHDYVLHLALALLLLGTLLTPHKVPAYPSFVDWQTIFTLTGLLVLTTGMEQSALFHYLARRIIARVRYESSLALLLTFGAALLSMFLTNDVALFIVVPLTLSLQRASDNDLGRLVIFEAIAANVGSLLTPIGNPQNIFLWHRWGVSFFGFIGQMFPLAAWSSLVLALFTLVAFPRRPIHLNGAPVSYSLNRTLLFVSASGFIGYLAAVEADLESYAVAVVLAVYLVFFPDVLKKVDWLLLVLFLAIFVDLHLLSDLQVVQSAITGLNLERAGNLYLLGVAASQLISNVPAALLLANFSSRWRTIAYAVNVGGNGLVIGSMANLIALRMVPGKKMWLRFHLYSVPFLLIVGTVVFLWL